MVQQKAKNLEDQGYQVILYGHRNHPEAKATVAYTQRGMILETIEDAIDDLACRGVSALEVSELRTPRLDAQGEAFVALRPRRARGGIELAQRIGVQALPHRTRRRDKMKLQTN